MEPWFAQKLIKWYQKHKRDLPWRHVKDPYKIWLSEIILQQTQVAQGLGYYLKFTSTYPTVKSLAKASEDKVLRLWQGLGYYSRARNLHFAAKSIVINHKGVFPTSYGEIKALKGIGDYTAAAIASFAYDLPHAVVDGNVYRVLSRVFGIYSPIDSTTAKKEFQNLANLLLDVKDPATYNQAIMEFGSQYCKPTRPDCENCVLSQKCFAFKNQAVGDLPVKAKKTKVRNRYFNYLVLIDKKGCIEINKRTKKDIWQGLYQFPLIESENELSEQAFLQTKACKKMLGKKSGITFVSKQYKHLLSHQHLYARFYVIQMETTFKSNRTRANGENNAIYVERKNLNTLAFPRLIEKFMNEVLFKEIV